MNDNKHYSITRACADGVSLLKTTINDYFHNSDMGEMMDMVVSSLINSPNIDDLRRDILKKRLPNFDASEYYLNQVLGMFPICSKFYTESNLSLERYTLSNFNQLYYTFYNNRCIAEIGIGNDYDDIIEICLKRASCRIKNTKQVVRARKYTIKKTYIVENETPSLYSITIINNEKYLIEYGLVAVHILEKTLSSLSDINDGWDNNDVYITPFYPYIKKIYDNNLVNGKIGVYKTRVFRIKNDIKLPSKMTTKLLNEPLKIYNSQYGILYTDDYYINSDFIKLVKSNADKPLLTDDELVDLFVVKSTKTKNKSKQLDVKQPIKQPIKQPVKPLYVPVEVVNDIDDDNDNVYDTSDNVKKTDNVDDSDNVDDYDKLVKTYNKSYNFDNENDILMNNYNNNPRVKQLLDEYDEIVFIKPIEKHYNTKYRYFNICLKTDIRRSNQYHIHLNNDGRIYSITEIRDLIN